VNPKNIFTELKRRNVYNSRRTAAFELWCFIDHWLPQLPYLLQLLSGNYDLLVQLDARLVVVVPAKDTSCALCRLRFLNAKQFGTIRVPSLYKL
jgi:hypothetical protein